MGRIKQESVKIYTESRRLTKFDLVKLDFKSVVIYKVDKIGEQSYYFILV